MISWKDIGIVLKSYAYGEKYKVVIIFTKEHGKIKAIAYKTKTASFVNCSQVNISYNERGDNSIGFLKPLAEELACIEIFNSENHLIVCQGICFIINKLLPYNASYPELFAQTMCIIKHLRQFDKETILFLYPYFEFTMLEHLGFSLNLKGIHTSSNINEIHSIISSHQFHQSVHKFFSVTANILVKNLTGIENFHRSVIIKKISLILSPK